jgi:ABC-type Zn uptake system ZnuABC Zn-binding protein ZnuA
MKNKKFYLTILVLLIFILSACDSNTGESDPYQIVVSTSIIGDVAEQINGGILNIKVLLAPGVDPHSYQPTPQDIAAITEADLVLINGYGLEEYLNSILNDEEYNEKIIVVSEGIEIDDGDPHVWLDPTNVVVWAENISDAFAVLQPENETEFRENARDYIQQLNELDNWIFDTLDQIPLKNRVLVSDHLSMGYFADRYGFEQAATISHSASSLAEPSAHELAELIDLIIDLGLPAVFIGHDVNPELAESLTSDLGIMLVELYIGSLSTDEGPASTYLELMRYNVEAIASALK